MTTQRQVRKIPAFSGWVGGGRAWTAEEMKRGPHERTIQGLRDMPPMHPGHPQPHVILPLAGSRKDQG